MVGQLNARRAKKFILVLVNYVLVQRASLAIDDVVGGRVSTGIKAPFSGC